MKIYIRKTYGERGPGGALINYRVEIEAEPLTVKESKRQYAIHENDSDETLIITDIATGYKIAGGETRGKAVKQLRYFLGRHTDDEIEATAAMLPPLDSLPVHD